MKVLIVEYHHINGGISMLTREENELLTRVGPGTPMGEMMRRYWMPALLSEEIAEVDGAPVRVKLLGEDLIAFRDSEGKVGLIDEFCPHRLASLVFARNEDCGVRCLYHGWKFDTQGNCVDMWSEPDGDSFREKTKIKSYPTFEIADMIFTYMGPPELQPEFPMYDFLTMPSSIRGIAKIREEANYLQGVEGALDSSHSSTLHQGTLIDYRPTKDKSPKIQTETTDYGFRYAAVRVPDKDPDKLQYVRVTNFVVPFLIIIPRPYLKEDPAFIQFFVPRDDTTTSHYWIEFTQDGSPTSHQKVREKYYAVPGKDMDKEFRKIRNLSNNYMQDREAMKNGHFTGIDGVPAQDMAMQESMGPIADRTRERLGKSDIAIIQLRRRMLQSVQGFVEGKDPIGLDKDIPYDKLRSEQKLISKDEPWQSVGAFAGEYSLESPSKS
jgi:phthalate 4,5-dioxygenase oxygenase subunit